MPNLGAHTKSWRDLLDRRKLQGVKARLPLASHCVCGPTYSRNNNEMFGVLPFWKSGTSFKKKKMKKKKKQEKEKKEKNYMKREGTGGEREGEQTAKENQEHRRVYSSFSVSQSP